ncbi:hypothetical protein BAE44_0015637 [Dichanthelium oligosanthes]|uniref:Uncharacterized protein n=1 Tax=Dichanthelium oligosanthes TaxID=888268 RepID=A0A1E5VEA7_9POAL|nr:hypothetical protein BAE44_0015637 [Dichanthelium oligosanthes]
MDPKTSYLLEIKLICNPKKARKDFKSFCFERAIDSDTINFKDLVQSIVDQYPPGYMEVAHIHYYDEVLKTFLKIKTDQELMSVFEKHIKTRLCICSLHTLIPMNPISQSLSGYLRSLCRNNQRTSHNQIQQTLLRAQEAKEGSVCEEPVM